MKLLPCPYLGRPVELTDERRAHILAKHPDLLPEHEHTLAETLAEPDQVRRDERFPGTRLFSRWFPSVREGKHVVVAVVTEPGPAARHWIVTAYIARKLSQGEIEWTRG